MATTIWALSTCTTDLLTKASREVINLPAALSEDTGSI